MKFCKKCNAETERYASGECKQCVKNRATLWYKSNTERATSRRAAYYIANKERAKVLRQSYYLANKEHQLAVSAAWRRSNPEKMQSYISAWHKANPGRKNILSANWRRNNKDKVKSGNALYRIANLEKVRASSKAWRKANPEATRVNNQNRRCRKRANGGKLSKGLSAKLFKLQRGLCPCCQQPLGADFHLDHIMPLSLGGMNIDSNIQLLRQSCNQQKSAKHPVEFMQSRGFLI